MKDSWKGIFIIAGMIVLVPWYLAGFDAEALGYWLQAAMALVIGAAIASPLINFIERRFGKGAAALVALLILPELVLFLHFMLLPQIFGLFEG